MGNVEWGLHVRGVFGYKFGEVLIGEKKERVFRGILM